MTYPPNDHGQQLPDPTRPFPAPPQYEPYQAPPVSGQPYQVPPVVSGQPYQQLYQGYSQPYGAPPPGFHPPQPPPKKGWSSGKIVALVVGVIAGMCLVGSVVAAIIPDSEPKALPIPSPIVTTAPARTGSPAPLSPVDKPAAVKMPDVRGQNAAVAQDYLQKLGFTNITFGSQDQFDTWVVLPENWTVKKQSTKAGAKIPTDTLIVLTCTKTG